MEINNYNQNSSTIYKDLANEKSQLASVDKKDKSTFEKNDNVDSSNNKNTQRDEESKKIENTVSSTPSLDNAKEELSKNGNLNRLFLQTLM
jgi:ABC-type transporter Mla subunit MlaD